MAETLLVLATPKNRCSLFLYLSILLVYHFLPRTLALSPTPSSAPVPAASSRNNNNIINQDSDPTRITTMENNNNNNMVSGIIKNFRNAAGILNVCRCAATDDLGETLDRRNEVWGPADHFICDQAGLILDLRSQSERKESDARAWMQHARGPIQLVESDEDYCGSKTCPRFVVRVDVLSPPRFMAYVEDQWFSPAEQAQAKWLKSNNEGRKLHALRIQVLNVRGLAGLNEAILETGKDELRRALQTMTLHLERNPEDTVVIHCVQGKDRTGMLTMLLQSMIGMDDETIVEDYFLSNKMLNPDEGSAAVKDVTANNKQQRGGRISRNIFSGTNREAIMTTLAFLRHKYGSVAPGYLDSIGFDAEWRRRLCAVLKTTATTTWPRSKL